MLSKKNNITTVNLMMTEQCNFRCHYCYEKFTNDVVSHEVIDNTIKLLKQSVEPSIECWLFGGEATTRPLEIKYTLTKLNEMVDETRKIVKAVLFTNGSILNQEIYEWINENTGKNHLHFQVQISFDGLGGANDSRVFLDGSKTEEKVLENIKKICELVPGKVIVRSTLAPASTTESLNLKETAKYLYELGVSEYSINLVQEDTWTKEKSDLILNKFRELLEWYEVFLETHEYLEFPIFPIDYIFQERDSNAKCGVGYNFFNINAKGKISPCHVIYSENKRNPLKNVYWNEFVGDVSTGLDDKPQLKQYEDIAKEKLKLDPCSTCLSRVCSVCVAVSINKDNDPLIVRRDGYCTLSKKLTLLLEAFGEEHLNSKVVGIKGSLTEFLMYYNYFKEMIINIFSILKNKDIPNLLMIRHYYFNKYQMYGYSEQMFIEKIIEQTEWFYENTESLRILVGNKFNYELKKVVYYELIKSQNIYTKWVVSIANLMLSLNFLIEFVNFHFSRQFKKFEMPDFDAKLDLSYFHNFLTGLISESRQLYEFLASHEVRGIASKAINDTNLK